MKPSVSEFLPLLPLQQERFVQQHCNEFSGCRFIRLRRPLGQRDNVNDRSSHGTQGPVLKCSSCGQSFGTKGDLSQHMLNCGVRTRNDESVRSDRRQGHTSTNPSRDSSWENPTHTKNQPFPARDTGIALNTLPAASQHSVDFSTAWEAPPSEPTVSCPTCGRSFLQSRLARHQQVCAATSQKSRPETHHSTERKHAITPPKRSTSWREKSAQLQAAMKAAKGEVVEVADNRVVCDACGRKFEEQTAKRHIPKCRERVQNNRH